jgi:type IV secretion system protein TrbG
VRLFVVGVVVLARALGAQDTVGGDAVAVAAREVRRGLAPRVVSSGGATVFPYGYGDPGIVCAVGRACVLGLESGERVVATTVGDSQRWGVTVLGTVVAVTPSECVGVSDLVVVTDRRVYTVGLTCGKRVTPYVRFWFPDAPAAPGLAFTYRWTHDPHVAWTPVAVYDDGERVFIRLPGEAREGAAPVLFQESGDGDRVLLNYTIDGDVYVTDRIFERAVLEASDGKRVRRVEIVNERVK